MIDYTEYLSVDTSTLPYLGAGISRSVWAIDDSAVIKEERGRRRTSNVSEWTVWQMVKDTPQESYFARVFAYSESGRIIMERVTCLDYLDKYELQDLWSKIAKAKDVAMSLDITDLHRGNLGLRADGSVCIIDYGAHMPTLRKMGAY